MYQVFNPAFAHLTDLVSWYWAVPYIAALAVIRNFPRGANRSKILYVGMVVTSIELLDAEVAVIALTVVSVTLVMLPPLNRQLILLLKSHAYLATYDRMAKVHQSPTVNQIQTLDPLTLREQEVLQLILSGKSNREIAGVLSISENTVKTHVRNIFSKYDVQSRAELISLLLKNQFDT